MEVEPRNVKKNRVEPAFPDTDFDLFNVDLFNAPPNHCFYPIESEQGGSLSLEWQNMRFSLENVFQNEIAAAAASNPNGHNPLALSGSFFSKQQEVVAEPMDLAASWTESGSSSSDGVSTNVMGTDVTMSSTISELFPKREIGSTQLQALLHDEQRLAERLEALYRSFSSDSSSSSSTLQAVGAVKKDVHGGLSGIENLLDTSALEVKDLYAVLNLKDRFETVLHKCSILENEERYLEDSGSVDAAQLVSLAWVSQPLAKSFKNKNRARASNKKKKGHSKMEAKLLCAPGVKFTPTSAVTAYFYVGNDDIGASTTLVSRTGRRRKCDVLATEQRSDVQIQNNQEKLEGDSVSFDFRFPAGTRNKPCSIRAHVRGMLQLPTGEKMEVDVLSEPTHRFIVTTNECQYENAEMKLMAQEMFPSGQESCSWARFVNALNVRWMRVTRQEDENAIGCVEDRVLSNDDLRYLAERFFSEAPNRVAYAQLSDFYSFFGNVTHVYRHNIAVRQLLMEGLIYGFVSKEEASQRLMALQPGSFLIRVSDVQPGTFAISWHDAESGHVRHARLDAKVLASSVGTIAEYVGSKPFLKFLYTPYAYLGKSGMVRRPTLRNKDDAFRHLYISERTSAPPKPMIGDGYDDLDQ